MPQQLPPTQETVKDWVEQIQTKSENLSPWETNFMKSVATQVKLGYVMSPKQIERIELIYANKVPLRCFKS